MKRFSQIITIITLALVSQVSWAQQDVMFTQYMFNGLSLNPAYAGSHNAISTNFIWRKQWVDIAGAPQSTSLSIHSPIGGDRIAGGLQLVHDKIGVSKELFANASLAYMMPVGDKAKLNFGLSAGLDMMEYNFNDLYLGSNEDVIFDPTQNLSSNKANFGAGLYYHTPRTFVGVSIPRLLENEYTNGTASYAQKRHYFVYAGHVFDIHPNFKFKPNVLFKITENAPTSIDLNANFLFIDKLWLGASYRVQESVDIIAQYNVTDQLSVGYAYDIVTNSLKKQSKGSHEIMLSYLFSFKKKAMLSPRYF